MGKHWQRLKRSVSRRWREWRLPRGYKRLGTRYGGWWIDVAAIGPRPLLIDCGLGVDISFPIAFLKLFPHGQVIGVDPNPVSLAFCRAHRPANMEIVDAAFSTRTGDKVSFHLPRPIEQLPRGADGVSGSLDASHEYVTGGETIETHTVDLDYLLRIAQRDECDVLKLDIEGAEYSLIEALTANRRIRAVRQLLIEFHHRVTHHTLEDTRESIHRIERAGFLLVHVEGRNHIFRRLDA